MVDNIKAAGEAAELEHVGVATHDSAWESSVSAGTPTVAANGKAVEDTACTCSPPTEPALPPVGVGVASGPFATLLDARQGIAVGSVKNAIWYARSVDAARASVARANTCAQAGANIALTVQEAEKLAGRAWAHANVATTLDGAKRLAAQAWTRAGIVDQSLDDAKRFTMTARALVPRPIEDEKPQPVLVLNPAYVPLGGGPRPDPVPPPQPPTTSALQPKLDTGVLNSPRFTPVDPKNVQVQAESVAVVIPPTNPSFSPTGLTSTLYEGRVVVAFGVNSGPGTGAWAELPPVMAGAVEPAQVTVEPAVLPADTILVGGTWTGTACDFSSGTPDNRFQSWFVDMQMVRLGGSRILFLKMGASFVQPQTQPCASALPNATDPSNGNTAADILLVSRSGDGGATWHSLPPILAATVDGGRYGAGAFFDRPTAYYDPFKRRLYVAVRTFSQGGLDAIVVLWTTDGDKWSDGVTIPAGGGDGTYFVEMTSTPDALFFLGDRSWHPTLFWTYDFDNLSGINQADVTYVQDTGGLQPQAFPCEHVTSTELLGNPGNPSTLAISRITENDPFLSSGTNRVRVAYSCVIRGQVHRKNPFLFARRQELCVVDVYVPHSGYPAPADNAFVYPVTRILPAARDAHIVQATFIETDRFEFDGAGLDPRLTDAAILYWFEVPDAHAVDPPPGITTRFARFAHGAWPSPSQPLAIEDGSPAYWTPNLVPVPGKPRFMGDYMKGAFFYLRERPGRLFFFTQWPQSEPAFAAPNAYLHYRVVSIGPEDL